MARTRYAAAERERWAKLNDQLNSWIPNVAPDGHGDSVPLDKAEQRRMIKRSITQLTDGKFKGHPAEFINKVWGYTDKEDGTKVIINSVKFKKAKYEWQDDEVRVVGEIKDKDGLYLGQFVRMIHGEKGEVHNDFMVMSDMAQASGIGAKFYEHSEAKLKQYGAKYITLLANLEVGGYAWARMGYDFQEEYERSSFIDKFNDFWIQSALEAGSTHEQAVLSLPKVKHAWDIASADDGRRYRVTKGSRIEQVHIGKAFLLVDPDNPSESRSWNAIKYLDDNAPTWQVGQVYYNIKKKGKGKP